MRQKVWTFSNSLSAARIVLMLPVIYFFMSPLPHNREYAVLFILLAVITDALDGYFARLFHEESEIGKIIDPLADKIGVGIVVVLLVIYGDIPLWFAGMILVRDALIFAGGVIVRLRKGIVLPSNMPGKIAVSFLALTLVLALLRYPYFSILRDATFWVSVVLLSWSFVIYLRRFSGILTNEPESSRQP